MGQEAALAIGSAIIIWGKVAERPKKMLLDTESAVTLIRQDVLEEITMQLWTTLPAWRSSSPDCSC